MCPDDEILSAYLDNEVPSPWKNRLEESLEKGDACREKLEQLRSVQVALRSAPEPDFTAAHDRVWNAVLSGVALRHAEARGEERRATRKISISLPLAAAAAIAILAIGIMGTYIALTRPAADAVARDLTPASTGDTGVTIRVEDIEQLLSLINSGEAVRHVNIEMPEEGQFRFSGEPRLIRAVDAGGARPFRDSQ